MNLKIEYLNKNELKPYANNAKIHTADQVEQIKKSIQEFGFNDPIAVWHDNEIVEGHGRLLAAMEMDEVEKVPVIRLDELTDEQRRAYMLAHNKLTMNTDFDLDLLSEEISELSETLDLTDFGFNEREILELTIDDSPEEISPIPVPTPYPTPVIDGEVAEYNPSEYGSPYQEQGYAGTGTEGGGITRAELEEYEARAEQMVTRRVIIVFKTDEEEAFIKSLLNVPQEEKLNVIYLAERLMENNDAE